MFVLHDVEGYKHEEIGDMLGVSPGTSKSQLHRARQTLRRLGPFDERAFMYAEAAPMKVAQPLRTCSWVGCSFANCLNASIVFVNRQHAQIGGCSSPPFDASAGPAADAVGTEFVRPCNLCPHMKRITLPKILRSLRRMEHQVQVDPEIGARARLAVERMLAVGRREGK